MQNIAYEMFNAQEKLLDKLEKGSMTYVLKFVTMFIDINKKYKIKRSEKKHSKILMSHLFENAPKSQRNFMLCAMDRITKREDCEKIIRTVYESRA